MAYVRPTRDWARDRSKSPELLTLERLRHEMVKATAREWLNVMDRPSDELTRAALPQMLYDTLADSDLGAARLAAQAFLDDTPAADEAVP
jgi:hypothetical protein